MGDTSVDADAGAKTVTTNGYSVITGLIKSMNPEHTVDPVTGVEFVLAVPAATPPTLEVPYTQAAMGRTFAIGKTLDSSDDTARLMLVTQYAGTKTVKVYADASGTAEMTTRLGRISIGVGPDGDSDTADDTYADLEKVGTYYQAGGALGDTADGLTYEDVVGAETKEGDYGVHLPGMRTAQRCTL